MKYSTAVGMTKLKIIDILRGTTILDTFKRLKEEQYLSRTDLDKIRDDSFAEIYNIAKNTTSFYRDLTNYDSIEVLTKDKIRERYQEFISAEYPGKLIPKGTGGSTGTPLIYLTTPEASSYLWAGILLSWDVAGYSIGDKVAFIAGTSIIKSDFKHSLFYKLLNIDIYSTYHLTDENISKYIEQINQSKTSIIYGYATAIDIMANYIRKKGRISFPYLKGIVSTAEVLTEESRKNIEHAFRRPVFNQYGCNEAGISAFECEYKNMHIIDTRCKLEIDDAGNLISTDLINKGFILMKYFTGDQIELSHENKCPCNRSYQIINNIKGRSYDIVYDNHNNILHAAFFNILFRGDETIKQFQIVFDKKSINIYLNVSDTHPEKNKYDKYVDAIKKHLSFDNYKLILNAPFIKSENAKHRYVINTDI